VLYIGKNPADMPFYMGNVLGKKDKIKLWEPNDVNEIKCVIEKGFSREYRHFKLVNLLCEFLFSFQRYCKITNWRWWQDSSQRARIPSWTQFQTTSHSVELREPRFSLTFCLGNREATHPNC
jgi:hypothetical protein